MHRGNFYELLQQIELLNWYTFSGIYMDYEVWHIPT